jgi:hypothetical protein
MKSLSPSAVILGPMTGIMLEAMIMDLLIFLLGKNLLAYLLGGVGALLSTIMHKLINLFILYGSDLLTVYLNLFEFMKKQLGLSEASPAGLLYWILGIYIVLGALAAASGYLLGRHAMRMQTSNEPQDVLIDPFGAEWKNTDPGQKFRIILLPLHLAMIPLMLILINRFGLSYYSLVPAGTYLVFLLSYYKRIVRRLMKPFFWVQLLIMTLVAGFFWHPPDAGAGHFGVGFLVGLSMCLRAILIVSAFSALSVEIRNPLVTDALLKLGMGNAYAAISLAFNSLPAMLDRSSDLKTFVTHPIRSFISMILEAERWLKCYQTQLRS